MNAIKRGKFFARERTRLENVIPLSVPFSIQIDICSACNLKCNFCFHSDREAIKKSGVHFGIMPFELFAKIIDDMKKSWGGAKVKKLRLFKIGEPLLNPDVCKMVKYAKDAEVAEIIEITTNGTLLNHEMNIGLIEAGLDILNISVNGISAEQYQTVCKYDMDFQTFRRQIEDFYQNKKQCKIFIKYSDLGYTEEEKKGFYQLFQDICDEIFVETISATLWQDTNIDQFVPNSHKGTYGQVLEQKQVCPFLFTTLVINDKGIAHLCCADWKIEYEIGDLKQENIAAVWNGSKLRNYQKLHLSKNKDLIEICKSCESLSANTLDNIDEYADDILDRLISYNFNKK